MSIPSIPGRRAAAALALIAMAAGATVASAHTEAVSTYPAKGATASKRTSKATVTYGEQLGNGTLTVRGPKGVVSRTSHISKKNVRKLYATLKRPLATGTYKATWKITAADGHKQQGSWTFKVR